MRTFRLGSLAKLRFHYCYHVCINREFYWNISISYVVTLESSKY